jgi:hypothetical protein
VTFYSASYVSVISPRPPSNAPEGLPPTIVYAGELLNKIRSPAPESKSHCAAIKALNRPATEANPPLDPVPLIQVGLVLVALSTNWLKVIDFVNGATLGNGNDMIRDRGNTDTCRILLLTKAAKRLLS